jgi:hypothetical protein
MKSLSISEIFRPMIILSTILGTHPFYKHKSTISWSRVKMLFSLTCILIYVATAVLFFIRFLDDTTDKIFIIMITIKCFGCMAVLLVIMFSSHANFRKNLKIMKDIAEIDTGLRNFGQEERIARSTYRHRKWLILLIFGNLFYNICSDCLVSLTNRLNLIDILVTITYPRIIVHNTNIIYCVVTMMIEERFKMVNELFHTLNPRSKEFSDKVNKLVLHAQTFGKSLSTIKFHVCPPVSALDYSVLCSTSQRCTSRNLRILFRTLLFQFPIYIHVCQKLYP